MKWIPLTNTTSVARVPGGMVLRERFGSDQYPAVSTEFIPHPRMPDGSGASETDRWIKENALDT